MHHQFEKLEIWKRSVAVTTDIYHLTSNFPKDEKFGLVSQIRRCSVSIPSNIAEGSGRNTNKQFAYFLSISRGSLYELQTQLAIALNLKYISQAQYSILKKELLEISNMIYRFKIKL